MTSPGAAVTAVLVANVGVHALIGDRIYPSFVPSCGTLPCVVWQQISGQGAEALDGDEDLAWPRVQVTCWATTYLAAWGVRNAVLAALGDYGGVIAGLTISRVRCIDDGSDMPAPAPGLETIEAWGVRMDFEVWHKE